MSVSRQELENGERVSSASEGHRSQATTHIPSAVVAHGWKPDDTLHSAAQTGNYPSPEPGAERRQSDQAANSGANSPSETLYSRRSRPSSFFGHLAHQVRGLFTRFGHHGPRDQLRGILLDEHRARLKQDARLQKRKVNRNLGLLEPDAVLLRRWHIFMAFVMAFELWAFPFRLAFGSSETWQAILIMDIAADVAFFADMGLQLFTIVPAGTYTYQDDPVAVPSELAKLYFVNVFPFEMLPSFGYYLVAAIVQCINCWLLWASTLPRLIPRARRLMRYFRSMECNLKVSVRALQGMKFSLILFLSAHWVGCIFYWLARLRGLDDRTWVAEFENLLPKFSRTEDSTRKKYLVTIYKGFNALSNLGYDLGLPSNAVEMIWSMLVMAFQVYLSALILGTLLNYLVAKDPVLEAHKLRMDMVREFANAKQLPADLQERIFRFLHFQHEKNVKSKATASMALPKSLELKVADCKYRSVVDKCTLRGNVFFGCDKNFLSALLVKLKVVHIMPGEEFVSTGGIPRELYFVLGGQVHVMDDENRIEKIIRNDDPDMSPICGEVPFFLGINHHNSLRAKPAGDVQVLVLSREECDELSAQYPEDLEVITNNILAKFGLDAEGEEVEGHQEEFQDKAKQLLRECIVSSIRRRLEERFAALIFAVNNGDIETVSLLARQGVDVNQVDYDGRSILHMACADGNYKLVEVLLDMGADKNCQDRWGNTPLSAAINNRQTLIVGLLSQCKARLDTDKAGETLCEASAAGELEIVRRLVENGVNPSIGDYDGRTALHVAAAEGQEKVVEYLLSKKADANSKDRWQGTPLKDAVTAQHTMLAGLLRARGGLLPEGIGAEQVCEASGKGDVKQLRLLHECGESMEVGDYDSRYPLHLAAAEARVLAVSHLLGISADPNCSDRWGGTPLDDALRGGTMYHMYCAKLIHSWGGKLGTLKNTDKGEQMLHELEHIDINDVRALIRRLMAAGYDNRVPKRLSESQRAVAFGATGRLMPVVAEMFQRTEELKKLLQSNVEASLSAINNLRDTLQRIATTLDKTAPRRRNNSLSVNLTSNLFGRVSSAMSAESDTNSAIGEQSSPTFTEPSPIMVPGSPEGHRTTSASYSMLLDTVDAGGDEDLQEVELVEGMDSDEELALYEELDALVEAQEKCQAAGASGEKVAAASFQKAALRVVEFGQMFDTLCQVVRMAQHRPADADCEPSMTLEELASLSQLLAASDNIDLDEVYEEAQAYHEEFGVERVRKAKDHAHHAHPVRLPQKPKKMAALVTRVMQAGQPEFDHGHDPIPVTSFLAGSHSFRRMVGGLHVDADVCFMMDTRLCEVLSEYEMRSLLPLGTAKHRRGDVVLDTSAGETSRRFMVVSDGELRVSSSLSARCCSLYRGDVFGALDVLSAEAPPPLRVTVVSEKCIVRTVATEALVEVLGGNRDRMARLLRCMGDAPAMKPCAKEDETAPDDSHTRGLGIGMLKRTFSRKNKVAADTLLFAATAFTPAFTPSSSVAPSVVADSGLLDAPVIVGEAEKKLMKELVHQIDYMWTNFSMGSSSFNRTQLRSVHKCLGEVSSECFKAMFLHIAQPENITANHFWKCWVDFLADEVFGAHDLEESTNGKKSVMEQIEEELASQTEEPEPEYEDEKEEVGCFEKLHAHLAPHRSLQHRFFEEEVLDHYEVAWEKVVGDTTKRLPVERVPQLLMHLFNDFGYRITRKNVEQFLVAFGRDKKDNTPLLWHDIRKLLSDYRMGVKTAFNGPLVGSAINPNWAPLARWRLVTRLCAVYYIVMVPVRIAFAPWHSSFDQRALLSDLVVDAIVLLDLILRINTSYKNRDGVWETRRSKLVRAVHLGVLFGALPWDWFGIAFGAGLEAGNWLRVPRLLYVLGNKSHLFKLSAPNTTRNTLEEMFRLLALILHWSACLWYYLGREYESWYPDRAISWLKVDDEVAHLSYDREMLYGLDSKATIWDKYVVSLYWVSATLTVNGVVGEVIPQNVVEVTFTVMLMVVNMTTVRWVLGEVSTIIMSADNEIVRQRENLEMIDSFITGNSLPPDLQHEIRNHYHSLNQGLTVDQGEIYAMLSHSLQMEVAKVVAREYLEGTELLKGCSDGLLDAVAMLLREVSFRPEQWLFHESESSSEMYLVVSGAVEEVVEHTNETEVVNVVHSPGAVGELPFYFGIRHFHSARATAGGAVCLKLDKTQFSSLMKLFHDESEIVSQNAIRVMEMVQSTRGGASSRGGGSQHSNAKSQKSNKSKASSKRSARSVASSRRGPGSCVSFGSRASRSSKRKQPELDAEDDSSGDDNATISSDQSRASNLDSDVMALASGGRTKNKITALKARRKNDMVTALLIAAADGDEARVESALAKDIGVNDVDISKRSALHVSASEGHTKVVSLLLSHSADPSMKDKFGNTALDDAVRHHRDSTARVLRERTPGLVISAKGKAMAVAMCQAAFEGSVSQIRRLVTNGANVNDSDYDGRTALHLAACEGHMGVCRYLLDKKGNVNAEDRFGGTPIQDAVRHKRKEVQVLLREYGAKLELGATEYSVKLCEAAASGDLELIRTLALNGVHLNAADYDGRTALHLAAAEEKVAVLEFLLAHEPKLEVNPCDRFGDTPLDDAIRHERPTATSMLKQRGGMRNGDERLQQVKEAQAEALALRQKKGRDPLINNALEFSPEQRALRWVKGKLEPTMQETSATLMADVQTLLHSLQPFCSESSDLTVQPHPSSTSPLLARAVDPNEEDRAQRAEATTAQVTAVRRSLLACMAVLSGTKAGGEEEMPIECAVWKSASRKYEAEAMVLRGNLRVMANLCQVTRKILKELIRREKRKARARRPSKGASYRTLADAVPGKQRSHKNLFAAGPGH